MKRIALADIHLSAYKDAEVSTNGLPLRLGNLIDCISKVCKYSVENKIYNIDILGDLYNDKTVIYADAQNAFIKLLNSYNSLTFHLIAGNHDLSALTEQGSSCLEALSSLKNVRLYNEACQVDNLAIVPYSRNLATTIKSFSQCQILLSHFGVSEAMLQSGMSMISDIGLKDLMKFNLILLGHYHKPQEIHFNNNESHLYYVGNPIHLSWNDKNESKRFLVYDTETLEVQSIPLTGYKEYKEFKIDSEEDINSIMEKAKIERNNGNLVKVRSTVKNDRVIQTDDIIVIQESVADITQRGINISMSLEQQCSKYMELKEIPEDKRSTYLERLKSVLAVKG